MSHDLTVQALEEIFLLGFNVPTIEELEDVLQIHYDLTQVPTVFNSYAQVFVQSGNATREEKGANPPAEINLHIEPKENWIAVHEAGHVIAGLSAGYNLVGVRFFSHRCEVKNTDIVAGRAIFDEIETAGASEDELLNLACFDVAGNVAQLVTPGCEPPYGGWLSAIYASDVRPSRPPTDLEAADETATCILALRHQRPFQTRDWSVEVRREKLAILNEAEARAIRLFRQRRLQLVTLSKAMMNGALPGSEIRRLIAW